MSGFEFALPLVGQVHLGAAFLFFLHLGSFFYTARVHVLFYGGRYHGAPRPPPPALLATLLGLWAVIWLFCITNRR
jgi:hypothetical protein